MITKVLVAFMTSTGNTRKVAEAIYDEITCDKEIRPIKEVQSIEGYDLSFLGFPTHQFGPDKRTRGYLEKFCRGGNKVALFVTHCAPEDVPEVQEWMGKFKAAASGGTLIGFFDCQGELSKALELMMSLSTKKNIRFFAKNHNSKGQPDESRLLRARAFARETMERLASS